MAQAELAGSHLRCVVGDNAPDPAAGLRAGANGLRALHVREGNGWSPSAVVFAGLNLEHYFDRRNWVKGAAEWTDALVYEPRHYPMDLAREGEALVLRQAATPFWGVESVTAFRLEEPDTVAFRCDLTPRRRGFEGPELAAFWATYVAAPEDPGFHYWSERGTVARHWHPDMGDRSTLCGPDEPTPANVPGSRWLFHNFAPERFALPLLWGRWRGRLLGLMLHSRHRLRLALGPTGGGEGNPAWDFQLIVPGYQVGHTYRVEAALVLGHLTPGELRRRAEAWWEARRGA